MMIKYTEEFESLWKQYPKRAGGNPKPKAFKALSARLKEKVAYQDLEEGLIRYAAFCEATGILNTPFIMQASTFFSANTESWTEDWEPPVKEVKQDKSNFPAGFDPSRQCSQGESMEACKTRAWRESGIR